MKDIEQEKLPSNLADAYMVIAEQREALRRLQKINHALIERIEESGAGGNASAAAAPYAAFEHAAVLAEQVRERTAQLSHTSDALRRSNENLRRANLAARTAHRRLVDAIESISDAFVLFDAEQRIRLFNHRFREYWQDLGLKVEIGMPRARLQLQAKEYDLVRQWQRDNENKSRVYQLTNGHWIQLSERLTGDGGRVLLYTDITDLKRSEEQSRRRLELAKQAAEQANLSKTKFLAAVSHDLLQPLNAARLFHGAMEEQPLSEPMQQLVGSAARSLDAVEELLRTLIDISKLDAGVLQAHPEPVLLADLLANLAEQHAPIAAQKQRQFRCFGQQLWVKTDPALLNRLLRNLLSNAFRYTNTNGKVLLGSRRRVIEGKRYVEIQVLDNGAGISAEALPHIFREFHRLSNAEAASQNGLGLGLAIVEKLAKLLGHSIEVVSRPAEGSMFSVRVPIIDAPQGQAAALALSLNKLSQGTGGARIAVVDNDPVVCRAMQTLLTSWGYQVEVFTVAPASVAGFDVVLVDFHLKQAQELDTSFTSEGNGLAWIKKWRQHTVTRFLMITANHSAELKQQLNTEQLSVMYKPIRPVKLRAQLQQLLGSGGRD